MRSPPVHKRLRAEIHTDVLDHLVVRELLKGP